MTPQFIKLFVSCYLQSKREAERSREVFLRPEDKIRLSTPTPASWRNTCWWIPNNKNLNHAEQNIS